LSSSCPYFISVRRYLHRGVANVCLRRVSLRSQFLWLRMTLRPQRVLDISLGLVLKPLCNHGLAALIGPSFIATIPCAGRTERSSGGKARWLGPCRPEFEPPWLRISGLSLGFAPNNIMLPLAWSHKGMRRASSSTGSWLDPVISQRTRSSDLSIVIGLFMYAWCECGVRV